MIVNNGNKINCEFADEIVSYLYNELSAKARSKFEGHLSNCAVCTDEFAAISDARFSVFEWQREEFANLPTPKVVIPFEQKVIVNEEGGGLFAGLRGLVALINMPIAAAVGLIVILAVGFVIFMRSDNRVQQAVIPTKPPVSEPIPNAAPVPQTHEVSKPEVATNIGTPSLPKNEFRAVKAVLRKTPVLRPTIADVKRPLLRPVQATPPVLNNFEADEDNSLRLADLMADLDG
jgi:hypothetical protein